ncbi:hypothetical protein BV509_20375 [Rhodovulum sulfidophilum]|nr:hypothetical protein BV509_20375 [Rhodovulum sulfidophilum]
MLVPMGHRVRKTTDTAVPMLYTQLFDGEAAPQGFCTATTRASGAGRNHARSWPRLRCRPSWTQATPQAGQEPLGTSCQKQPQSSA